MGLAAPRLTFLFPWVLDKTPRMELAVFPIVM